MEDLTIKELVSRLRQLAGMKVGADFPAWMGGPNSESWGPPLSELCRQAADEIEFRGGLAGAVSRGRSFSEIKATIPSAPKADPL